MKNTLTNEELECLRGCSQYAQYYQGRKDFENATHKSCPFCKPYPPQNKVRYSGSLWTGWEVPQNFTTRKSTLALQFVFFPSRHIRRHSELTTAERLEFFEVIDWLEEMYEMPGGGLISRFGDMEYNVGTIMHLHATVMVPNRQGEVSVFLQKDDELWQEHDQRMRDFAARYEDGEVPEKT